MTIIALDIIPARQFVYRGKRGFHTAIRTTIARQFTHDGENPLLAFGFIFFKRVSDKDTKYF
jgi:hypothetical protein